MEKPFSKLLFHCRLPRISKASVFTSVKDEMGGLTNVFFRFLVHLAPVDSGTENCQEAG